MEYVGRKVDRDRHIIEAVVRRFGPVSRVQIYDMSACDRGMRQACWEWGCCWWTSTSKSLPYGLPDL